MRCTSKPETRSSFAWRLGWRRQSRAAVREAPRRPRCSRTASGEDGLAFVKGLGADAVVDAAANVGTSSPPPARSRPRGVDAVLAFAGGDSLERCVDALRAGGRIAYPYGVRPDPKARDDTAADDPLQRGSRSAGEFERLNHAIEAAKLEVPIAAEFPLAEAAKAQERVEAGHILGKIVLRPH